MENLRVFIKPVLLFSFLCGIILGFLTLIPVVNFFITLTYWLVGGLTVFYLKRNNSVGILSLNDGTIIGAIAGFVAVFSAALVYIPLAFILGLFIKSYAIGFNMNVSFLVASFNIFVTFMLVFFVGLLNSLFSAFSGLVVAFIYEKTENNPEKNRAEFVIEIDDN